MFFQIFLSEISRIYFYLGGIEAFQSSPSSAAVQVHANELTEVLRVTS